MDNCKPEGAASASHMNIRPAYTARVETSTPLTMIELLAMVRFDHARDWTYFPRLQRLTYNADPSFTIEINSDDDTEFREEWMNVFPDKTGSKHYVTLRHNNSVLADEIFIGVDGGRAMLPLPELGRKELVTTYFKRTLGTIINKAMDREDLYEQYLESAGFRPISGG